jgi:PhoH-like ATPase
LSRKTFIIDTNVVLHDPDAIFNFEGSDVSIPLTVIEELDRMKRLSDELGRNARQVIRFMDSLKEKQKGDLHSGIELDNGIVLKILIESQFSGSKDFPLSLDKPDNRILQAAYEIQKSGKRVVLVSKDLVVRVKAEAIGIEAQDYENLKESYDQIYKGYRKLEVEKRR